MIYKGIVLVTLSVVVSLSVTVFYNQGVLRNNQQALAYLINNKCTQEVVHAERAKHSIEDTESVATREGAINSNIGMDRNSLYLF